jgi:hypothetical protein
MSMILSFGNAPQRPKHRTNNTIRLDTMSSQSSTPATRRKRNAAIATIASTDPEFMTPAQLHLRQMIVDSAEEAFRQHGIKKVTMDEVAKNIHMSKRTLYQFFRDKEELVLACVKSTLDREQEYANQAAMRSENALQLIFDVMQYRMTDSATTSEYYFRDITIYPTVTQYFKMRRAQCTARFIELLHIGVQQGLFVDTINFEVFGGCMSLISEHVLQRKSDLENVSFTDYVRHFVITLFRGCTTEKGRTIIDDFCQNHFPN